MSPISGKDFAVALLVILVVHTSVSMAAYRLFTNTENFSRSPVETDVTTPEQAQRGERSFRMLTKRSTIPLPIYFYIVFGYAELGAALGVALFTWVRHHRQRQLKFPIRR